MQQNRRLFFLNISMFVIVERTENLFIQDSLDQFSGDFLILVANYSLCDFAM